MTLKNNRAPLPCYFKLCASFCSHWWIQTGVTVRKSPIWVKFYLEIWGITFKNNRTPLLRKSSFMHHFIIICEFKLEFTFQKRLSWAVTSVTLNFDFWPWPFAWTSLLSLVITPENFMMIWWWEHSEKGVTDRQTVGWTDWAINRAAWSQLKRVCVFHNGGL